MWDKALSNDAVLDSDVWNVTIDGESLVTTPRDAHMVKNNVLAVRNTYGIFAWSSPSSHSDGNVSHDGIIGIGQGPAISINNNTLDKSVKVCIYNHHIDLRHQEQFVQRCRYSWTQQYAQKSL